MRTLSASYFMSLDGVIENPQDWHFPTFTPDVAEAALADTGSVGTILLGRVTYQEWLPVWPAQGTSNPMATFLNQTPKYVASRTLGELDWDSTTLIKGDVVDALTAEKAKEGGEIAAFGSGDLVTTLIGAGLVDELRLLVHPVLVGSGRRLFDGGPTPRDAELTESTVFPSGVLRLNYRLRAVER